MNGLQKITKKSYLSSDYIPTDCFYMESELHKRSSNNIKLQAYLGDIAG